jgi:hypothetical protein
MRATVSADFKDKMYPLRSFQTRFEETVTDRLEVILTAIKKRAQKRR